MANQSFNDIENEILGIFVNAWGNREWTIENDELNPPDDAPWARATTTYATNITSGIGAKVRKRRTGIFIVQIFTVSNRGTQEANELVQILVNAFENASSTRIKFFDITPNRIGLSGKFLQVNLSITFRFDVLI